MCGANPAVPGSAHRAIFNAPAHTALSGAWWELKFKKHCCFTKALPGRPLSSVCHEAIWCWACPVLSPELQMALGAAGEAQLTGRTFMVLLVLKLSQGPFLVHLLILCQHNTRKDSATQGKQRQHQPLGQHLGWSASLGCSCPEQTAVILARVLLQHCLG